MLKKLVASVFLLSLTSLTAFAQFRTDAGQPEPKLNTLDAMRGGDSFLSSLFDPARWSMHQTYSMSFLSSGAGSTGISALTNTFSYRASDDLFISADVSAVYSPFSTFGDAFSKSLNGIYLSSARMDWKMGENTFMRIEYVGGPNAGYGGYSPFYNPFYEQAPTRNVSSTGIPKSIH
jgi:hypothetical protein